jgi:hypothetical protein
MLPPAFHIRNAPGQLPGINQKTTVIVTVVGERKCSDYKLSLAGEQVLAPFEPLG